MSVEYFKPFRSITFLTIYTPKYEQHLSIYLENRLSLQPKLFNHYNIFL